MKTKIIASAALATLVSQQVLAEGQGYIGASMGSASTDNISAELDTALVACCVTTSSTTMNDDDTGFKVFGGYLFNEFWGVEGGYMDFGEFSFNGATTGPAVTYSGDVEIDTWYLAGVLNLPVAENINISARAGLAMWDASVNVTAGVSNVSSAVSATGDDDGTDAMLGVGVAFGVTDNLAIRVDFDRIETDEEVDLISAGIQMTF